MVERFRRVPSGCCTNKQDVLPCHHVNLPLTPAIPIVMPALPSFISYRRGKKAKAAIMAPFSLLRGDSSTASSSASYHPFTPPDVVEPDVIDINHSHYPESRDPSTSFEQDVSDNPRSSSQLNNISTSPQVELDIDLSSNGLSDWLEAFSSGDPKKEALAKRRLTRLNLPVPLSLKLEQLKEGEGELDRGPSSSEDMLQAMDVSCKVQSHLWH
jgi:hypothetical protein